MTLRMDLACAAMAALALVVSDVRTLHAFVEICDVMPERCYYKPNGGRYYMPPPLSRAKFYRGAPAPRSPLS